jgi:hypothetical protein
VEDNNEKTQNGKREHLKIVEKFTDHILVIREAIHVQGTVQ